MDPQFEDASLSEFFLCYFQPSSSSGFNFDLVEWLWIWSNRFEYYRCYLIDMESSRLIYLNVYILEFTVRLYSNKVEKYKQLS